MKQRVLSVHLSDC